MHGAKTKVVYFLEKLLVKIPHFIIFYIVDKLLFGINTSAPSVASSSSASSLTTAESVLALIDGKSLIPFPTKKVFSPASAKPTAKHSFSIGLVSDKTFKCLYILLN